MNLDCVDLSMWLPFLCHPMASVSFLVDAGLIDDLFGRENMYVSLVIAIELTLIERRYSPECFQLFSLGINPCWWEILCICHSFELLAKKMSYQGQDFRIQAKGLWESQ